MSIFKKILGIKEKPEPVKAPVYRVPPAPAPVAQRPIAQPIQQPAPAAPAPKCTITIVSQPVDYDEQVPELSCLDFGGVPGSADRFLNYSFFKISGYDKAGKKRYRIRTGKTSEDALRKVSDDELSPPYDVQKVEPEPATDRQLELLKRHGTSYPPDLLKDAASEMIDRIVDDERRDGPDPYLVTLAAALGTEFSVYVGAEQLFEKMIRQSSDRDRAALYAYAVRQSIRGAAFENMLADPDKDIFYTFADAVVADASLVKSLNGREPSDFRRPNKGTSIYKQAVAFFGGLR